MAVSTLPSSHQTPTISIATVIYIVMNVLLVWDVIALQSGFDAVPTEDASSAFPTKRFQCCDKEQCQTFTTLLVGIVLAASFGCILSLFVTEFTLSEIATAALSTLGIVVGSGFIELWKPARLFFRKIVVPLLFILGTLLVAATVFVAGSNWWPEDAAVDPLVRTCTLYGYCVFIGFAIAYDIDALLIKPASRSHKQDPAFIAVTLFLDIVKLFPSLLVLRRGTTDY